MLPSTISKSTHRSLHGTCVAINGQGLLITGKPGTGKSMLALALLKQGHQLISDDLTTLTFSDGKLIATCPPIIKNLLHVRNVGFIDVDKTFGENAVTQSVAISKVLHLSRGNTEC